MMHGFRQKIAMIVLGVAMCVVMGCEMDTGKLAQVSNAHDVDNTAATASRVPVAKHVLPSHVRDQFYFINKENIIASKYMPALQSHAKYLLAHPQVEMLLIGYAAISDNRAYNLVLGQRYANAVAKILRMQGVPETQIRTFSYGSEKNNKDNRVDLIYTAH